jgi:hypothetical protein
LTPLGSRRLAGMTERYISTSWNHNMIPWVDADAPLRE